MTANRLFGALLLAATLHTPAAAQDGSTDLDLSVYAGVTVPTDVGEFQALRLTRWPDEALGIGVTYVIPRFPGNFSMYVYPAARDLAEEFDTSMESIRQYAEQNSDGMTVEEDSTSTITVNGRDGFLGVTQLSGTRGDSRSLLYLFEKDGSFIKYRFTFDPAMRTIVRERLDELLQVTLEAVHVRGTGDGG